MPEKAEHPGRIVIVGGSVAGARTAQALRAEGFAGELIVVEPDTGEAYDRPPLSKEYLTGAWTREQIELIPGGWASIDVTVVQAWADSLDAQARRLTLSNGETLDYDRLVIATGLAPRRLLTTDGAPIGHVIGTAADADALRDRLKSGGSVVAIGGGFVAAEAASVARELGLSVTILERREHLLQRSLGTVVGAHISEMHRANGVDIRNNVTVESIERDGEGALLALSDGTRLQAETLIVGIGSEPNTAWLEGSTIKVDDGVVTDARFRALGGPGVYAVGDIARFYDVNSAKSRRVGHWTNATDQSNVVAHNLLNPDDPNGYREAPYFWSDQFGQKIQVAGHPEEDAHVDVLTLDGPVPRLVAVYTHGDDQDCGAVVTFGWPRGMAAARRLMHLEPKSAEMIEELEKLAAGARTPVPA